MVNPRPRLSRNQFLRLRPLSRSGKSPAKMRRVIDTSSLAMLPLLVLETALLPSESASKIGKETIVSSVSKEWNRHSDN